MMNRSYLNEPIIKKIICHLQPHFTYHPCTLKWLGQQVTGARKYSNLYSESKLLFTQQSWDWFAKSYCQMGFPGSKCLLQSISDTDNAGWTKLLFFPRELSASPFGPIKDYCFNTHASALFVSWRGQPLNHTGSRPGPSSCLWTIS